MKKLILQLLFLQILKLAAQPLPEHNLRFEKIPDRWDEALPLGNAMLGCLVWQKDAGKIRLALDRADLWDTRPMPNLDQPQTFNYQWIAQKIREGKYNEVQEKLDLPYEQQPAPTKLPSAAALEFPIKNEKVKTAELDNSTGLATVEFESGLVFQTFVHASRREGWFRFSVKHGMSEHHLKNWSKNFPEIVAPAFADANSELSKLGYSLGGIEKSRHSQVYHQPCWGGFSYQVAVVWQFRKGNLEGVWTISSHFPAAMWAEKAEKIARKSLGRGFEKSFSESKKWWASFWKKSNVRLPDPLLDRQYHLEEYKFGCLARPDAPAISLQGIWTADNGQLPPWKGDFHHDLNTEMSYWHALTANHADLATGFLRFVASNDAVHRRWTKQFFGTDGLNVPGVETLLGEPMGGWVQYACSPTTSAWLAHQFYRHWQATRDRDFLKNTAFPMLEAVAQHLEQLTRSPADTFQFLPFEPHSYYLYPPPLFLDPQPSSLIPQSSSLKLSLSSSPEMHENRANAWFTDTWTNYDLALARFVFGATISAARILEKPEAVERWQKVIAALPDFSVSEKSEMHIAPDLSLAESHRHFSHLLAVFPLELLAWQHPSFGFHEQGWERMATQRKIIAASLRQLDSLGTDGWTGYSFAWRACLAARARDSETARRSLRIFAEAFVSKNSFHLNGDQSGRGFSKNTSRPFTLEGGFAFAAGVQEMLLQSHGDMISVFTAVPADWREVSFQNFLANGCLVSGEIRAGIAKRVEIFCKKEQQVLLDLPEGDWEITVLKGKWENALPTKLPKTKQWRNAREVDGKIFKKGQPLILKGRGRLVFTRE